MTPSFHNKKMLLCDSLSAIRAPSEENTLHVFCRSVLAVVEKKVSFRPDSIGWVLFNNREGGCLSVCTRGWRSERGWGVSE